MVTVVARIEAKKGKENEVKQALLALVPITQEESGCVQYDLHQAAENPCEFVFYENWQDQASIDRHLKAPHVQLVLSQVGGFLAKPPEIKMFRKIS